MPKVERVRDEADKDYRFETEKVCYNRCIPHSSLDNKDSPHYRYQSGNPRKWSDIGV